MSTILIITLTLLGVISQVYEIRNETEEERIKRMWLFDHGLY